MFENEKDKVEEYKSKAVSIISDMLDNPDSLGIYETTKAYQRFNSLIAQIYNDIIKFEEDRQSSQIENPRTWFTDSLGKPVGRNWDESEFIEPKQEELSNQLPETLENRYSGLRVIETIQPESPEIEKPVRFPETFWDNLLSVDKVIENNLENRIEQGLYEKDNYDLAIASVEESEYKDKCFDEETENKSQISVAQAFERIEREMNIDSSYYEGWKSNLAMAVYDEFLVSPDSLRNHYGNYVVSDIHQFSNDVAERIIRNVFERTK